jgi:hypothetical protein
LQGKWETTYKNEYREEILNEAKKENEIEPETNWEKEADARPIEKRQPVRNKANE